MYIINFNVENFKHKSKKLLLVETKEDYMTTIYFVLQSQQLRKPQLFSMQQINVYNKKLKYLIVKRRFHLPT